MKKIVIFIVILNLMLCADNYTDAISKINRIRNLSGLPSLKFDSRLKNSAYRHARYLGVTGESGHYEYNRRSREYFGKSPSSRIVKAGYKTKAVVENISFGERTYSKSIDTLMATIYHRLGFLDFRIDSIGPARAGRRNSVFVYDMSLSKLDNLCRKRFALNSQKYIYNICSNNSIKIPAPLFYSTISSIEKRASRVVRYPYPNQRFVPSKYRAENPNAIPYIKNAGYPISIVFNPSYYRRVTLKSFRLSKGSQAIRGKILLYGRDRYKKLPKNSFIFIPYSPLSKGEYRVDFKGIADGRVLHLFWKFGVEK